MVLNEELSWHEVGEISTGSGRVRDAFQLEFGAPTKERLPAGMSIYKFSSFKTLASGALTDATELSPWWTTTNEYKQDAGISQRKRIAQLNGVSFREWGRLTSVIKEDWSSMAWLLTIELKVPVYAWFGGFKSMSRVDNPGNSQRDDKLEKKGSSKNLPGGGTQFYIPNLTYGHVGKFSSEAI